MCLSGLTIVPYCVLELVKQECFKPNSTYKRRVSLVHPYAFLIAAFWVPKKGDQVLWRELTPRHQPYQTSSGDCHSMVSSRYSCCRLSWNWLSDMIGFFFLLAQPWKPRAQGLCERGIVPPHHQWWGLKLNWGRTSPAHSSCSPFLNKRCISGR